MNCPHCKAEVQQGDKFCSTCGKPVRRDDAAVPKVSPTPQGDLPDRCSICGHMNKREATYCESCGAALRGHHGAASASAPSQPSPSRKAEGQKSTPSGSVPLLLQSWKLTLGLAVVFIAVLVFVETSSKPEPHVHEGISPDMAARAAQVMAEIKELEQRVENNPEDAESMLLLANRLHDMRFFPRAITMYKQYLQLKPADADARVDLGICYFETALIEGNSKTEYFEKAQAEMKQALTYEPKHQLAHFNLAIVYLQGGNMQEANAWFKKCIDLNPDSETGKRARELYNQHQITTIQ